MSTFEFSLKYQMKKRSPFTEFWTKLLLHVNIESTLNLSFTYGNQKEDTNLKR